MELLRNSTGLRFLVCGGFAALVNWLARIGLSLFMPFTASVIIAYLIGMVTGFILYRNLVWPRSVGGRWLQQVPSFIAVNAAGAVAVLVLSLGLVVVGSKLSAQRDVVEASAHGLAIGLGAVINFLGHGRFTFR